MGSANCESLSHGYAVPAPFGKGAFGVQRRSPPCQRGVPRLAEAGGFRRQSLRNFLPIPSSLFPKKPSPFHMGSYFGKVPPVNPSVKNQRFLPAPFGKGAFLRPVSLPGGNRGSAPKPPLSKGGGLAKPNRGDTQALPGYFFPNHSSLFTKKPSPFHMGLYFGKVPTVNPSVKNQRFLPAPFGKGAFGAVPIPGAGGAVGA